MNKAMAVCILIVVSLVWAPQTRADMTGASDSVIIVKLTAIYNVMKEYYDNGMQILQQAKMQSDNLKKMSQLAQEAKGEYDFCTNFSIQNELKKIERDIEGLTSLDNLEGKTPEQIFRTLRSEIDRRFRYGTAEEKEKAAELKSHVETMERLNALKEAKTQESVAVGTTDRSQKDHLASIASSCALMSSLQLAREQRRVEEELGRQQSKIEADDLTDDFDNALDKMK